MSTPTFSLRGLKKTKPLEHVVRFLFGGTIAVFTGVIAHAWGPDVGGLFLAFPAILPASLTMVHDHDGRASAVKDAEGARHGTLGLVAFALVMTLLTEIISAPWAIVLAVLAWGAVSYCSWSFFSNVSNGGNQGGCDGGKEEIERAEIRKESF